MTLVDEGYVTRFVNVDFVARRDDSLWIYGVAIIPPALWIYGAGTVPPALWIYGVAIIPPALWIYGAGKVPPALWIYGVAIGGVTRGRKLMMG